VPKCARDERRKSSPETRLLSLGRDPEIHVVPQPVVCVYVPEAEISTSILRCLNLPWLDVGEPIPFCTIGGWIDAIVTDATENACTLRQAPDTVVLHACGKAQHVKLPHPAEEAIFHVLVAKEEGWVVVRGELQEGYNPKGAIGALDSCGQTTTRDFALLACWWSLGRVSSWWKSKHGSCDVVTVVTVVEGWAGHDGWKEEDIASVVEEIWHGPDSVLFLEFG
jgi:hypothetical protein